MLNTPPCILIVEDEPAIAELIGVNLKHSGFESVWARDSVEAQRVLDNRLPDVILLDWMLPGQSGVSLARKWRADDRYEQIPILLLTAKSDEANKIEGLDVGADDYITKPFSVKELLARIRVALRRKSSHSQADTVSVGALLLDPTSHRVSYDGKEIKLGPTEFKLLSYLMKHSERVHSRTQLLDQVWGDQAYIEERTVDVHVKRLREALGLGGRHVETVRGAGYRLTALVTDSTLPSLGV